MEFRASYINESIKQLQYLVIASEEGRNPGTIECREIEGVIGDILLTGEVRDGLLDLHPSPELLSPPVKFLEVRQQAGRVVRGSRQRGSRSADRRDRWSGHGCVRLP